LTGTPIADEQRAGEDVTVALVATPGEVVEAVRVWLDEFMREATGTD
jgi:hypothetical protein